MGTKDFTSWQQRKILINNLTTTPYFRIREVWWTSLGANIGSEEDGKGQNFTRPVLVIYKFNQSFFYGLPLSTTSRTGRYYHPLIIENCPGQVILSQLRALDARRLRDKIDSINPADFHRIQARLVALLATSLVP